MEYSIFRVKLRSRYLIILMGVFDVIVQIIGWITLDKKLFYYKECSFNMKGNSICYGETISNKCFAETNQDCDIAFTVVQLYLYAIIILGTYVLYTLLISIIYCFCKSQNFGLIKFNFTVKIIIQFVSSALFFYSTSSVKELENTSVSVNGQITTTCISLGVLCCLSAFCQLYINYELYYLNEVARIIEAQENNYQNHRTSTQPVDHNQIQLQQYPQNNNYGQVPQARYNQNNNYRMRQN